MKYIKPDFYDTFVCKADKCAHTCCKGWEIDIDDETLSLYDSLGGEIGGEIRANIKRGEPASFVLTEDERCPFLGEDGLCRLILKLGDGALCDICAEHPRFYNELYDRTEMGLGLCCEEAVRLLLSGSGRLGFVGEDDGESAPQDERDAELLSKRRRISDLVFSDAPLSTALEQACAVCEVKMPEGRISEWAEFFSKLERMDESWGERLSALSGCGLTVSEALQTKDISLKRLAEYLIYRHFANYGESTLPFVIISAALISAMNGAFGDLAEIVRQFSSEIEYSDENIEKILERFT